MVTSAKEYNFDGLVGPCHNYGGLAFGNLASQKNEGSLSSPKTAALQGLAKMRAVHALGIPQAVLPPHMRPDLALARRLGFFGDDAKVLADVARDDPRVLAACYSASALWTANAATVSPSADSADGRLHLTPANLQNQVHRSIEAETSYHVLRAVFRDEARFSVHEPLPGTAALGDEGAANHTRFAPEHGARGLQLFVYGASASNPFDARPKNFPARQTREASEAIIRLHRLPPEQVALIQQNPEVIDQGVFHNDVIAVGNGRVLFFHEKAFRDGRAPAQRLAEQYHALTGDTLALVEVPDAAVSVADAVSSYLFNSQLVTQPDGSTGLIAPLECKENDNVRAHVEALVEGDSPIDAVHHFDLRQSMQGGGGPACLRLRVVMTEAETENLSGRVLFDDALDAALVAWVDKHYRDALKPEDLADPALLEESRVALDELSQLLELGSIYPFQRESAG